MQLAILNANVFTGDDARPRADAVLIEDGLIKLVGSSSEIQNAMDTDAVVHDLPGCLVTPGLVDAHAHFTAYGRMFLNVNLTDLNSLKACREKIQAAVNGKQPGEWITGWGWNQHAWEEGREPTAADLDDITPENPVMIHRMCGHSVWVNSLAMSIAGITRETPDPPGGCFMRDENGFPNGLLKECGTIVEAKLPPETTESRRKAALAAQEEALRRGLTGVHSLESLDEYLALGELDRDGALKIRVHHSLPPTDLDKAKDLGITAGTGTPHLWFHQVKLFTDGSLGSGTALLFEEYSDEPGQFGIEFTPPAVLTEHAKAAYDAGCDVAIHAIGDKALSNALDVYEAARKDYPSNDHRDRVEHLQLFKQADLDRLIKMDVTASIQPSHLITDWHVSDRRWGAERAPRAYAYESIRKSGARVQFGSDAPVMAINPLLSIFAAAARQDTDLKPEGGWHPEEKMDLAECIKAYSAGPAYTARKEDVLGSITPGQMGGSDRIRKGFVHAAH